jgi:hypothetical protein
LTHKIKYSLTLLEEDRKNNKEEEEEEEKNLKTPEVRNHNY